MDEKILEFSISGCIYTGDKEISLDDLSNKFIDFCEQQGWQFCGTTNKLQE